MKSFKSSIFVFFRYALSFVAGLFLYLVSTEIINFLLSQRTLPEKSFIFKYFSISSYFYDNFLENFFLSYTVCLIYYAAYWILKYLDFHIRYHAENNLVSLTMRKKLASTRKALNWNTRQFFLRLIIPALVLAIMLSIHEDDSVKFLFPVTLLLAVNNTRLLFLANSNILIHSSKKAASARKTPGKRRPRRSQSRPIRKRSGK